MIEANKDNMISTIGTISNSRLIPDTSDSNSMDPQRSFRLTKSKSHADQANSLRNKWGKSPKKLSRQLPYQNSNSGTIEVRVPKDKGNKRFVLNDKQYKDVSKLPIAPSSPTSHVSFQERQPKDFFTPHRAPLHSNPCLSNPLPKSHRLFKLPTQAIESQDDCASSVISSLSADDSQLQELDVIDCRPIVHCNLFSGSSRIRSNIDRNQYPLPPTIDRTPCVGLRHSKTSISTKKLTKPQLSHQMTYRDRSNQSLSTGIRTKQDYLYGTPPRSYRPSSIIRRGRSFSYSVTSDAADSSFASCPPSPMTPSQDAALVGQRKRFTPKSSKSHRRNNSGGSSTSTYSDIGTIANTANTSVTDTECLNLYESQNEEDKSVSLIQSYNEAERRKVKNVVKEEIKYMIGNLVPKPFKNDKSTVDFSKKVDLKRSNGYLT